MSKAIGIRDDFCNHLRTTWKIEIVLSKIRLAINQHISLINSLDFDQHAAFYHFNEFIINSSYNSRHSSRIISYKYLIKKKCLSQPWCVLALMQCWLQWDILTKICRRCQTLFHKRVYSLNQVMLDVA